MIEVSYENGGTVITGFLGKPETARGNRSCGYFYLNGRYIKSDIVRAAVESAYRTRLPAGKFPFYALHMKMPAHKADVNVHPAKLEVRFENEEEIYNHIFTASERALSEKNLIPGAAFREKKEERPVFMVAERKPAEYARTLFENKNDRAPEKTIPNVKINNIQPAKANRDTEKYIAPAPVIPPLKKHEPAVQNEITEQPDEWPLADYRVAGKIFETYWIMETGNAVYLLDQHAAHERITYERLLDAYKNKKYAAQKLLEPVPLGLTHAETETLSENIAFFLSAGFEIEECGNGTDDGTKTYALTGVPLSFDISAGSGLFIQILDKFNTLDAQTGNPDEAKLAAIAGFSCKASVKAGGRLTETEARSLADELSLMKNPFSCPHGRPTVIEITRYEIEKRFKRV